VKKMKKVNVAALALSSPLFRQRKVEDRKKYNRKREKQKRFSP